MSVTASADLRKWIEERFAPVVLIASSADADQVCKNNGVRFTELLRRYQRLSKDITVRTVREDGSYQIRNFGTRLHTKETLKNAQEDSRYQYFNSVVSRSKPDDEKLQWYLQEVANDPCPSYPNQDQECQSFLRNLSSPWFESFRQDFFLSCRFNYWDTLDHPNGIILAVSTEGNNQVKRLQDLYTDAMQSFGGYCVDTNIHPLYVLLHDVHNGPPEITVKAMFDLLKTTFGHMNTKLIPMGSQREAMVARGIFWGSEESGIDKACFGDSLMTDDGPLALNTEEVDKARAVMAEYIEAGLVPFLERKMRILANIVNQKQKGQFKKVLSWFGAGKEDKEPPKDQDKFHVDSFEMQTRRLADLVFILRDYHQAVSYYKTLKGELTSSTSMPVVAIPYLASCHEAIGLCLWLQGRGNTSVVSSTTQTLTAGGAFAGSRKDSESSLEAALQCYTRCYRSDYAMRVSLLLFALCKARQANLRGADVMARASTIETIEEKRPLYAALCFEQTALCYLSGATVCYYRKFAMYLVLAATRYAQCNQTAQAIRCNELAATLYQGKKWKNVDDHLARQLSLLYEGRGKAISNEADILKAIAYMRQFVRNCNLPRQKQEVMLTGFCNLLSSYLTISEKELMDGFKIPTIDVGTPVESILIDRYGYYGTKVPTVVVMDPKQGAPPPLLSGDNTIWRTLQVAALDRGATLHESCNARNMVCVVHETVYIAITLVNPLNIPVLINDLSLVLVMQSDSGDGKGTPLPHASPIPTIELDANETRTERLAFMPTQEGTVELTGVSWTLCGKVRGCRKFHERDTENAIDIAPVGSPTKPYTQPAELSVKVAPAMPSARLSFDPPITSHLFEGQVVKTYFIIENGGPVAMSNIKLAFTHPQSITFKPCAAHHTFSTSTSTSSSSSSCETISLDGVVVEPGKSVRILSYIRGAYVGSNSIAILVTYSNAQTQSHRMARCSVPLKVTPCLLLRAYALPSPAVGKQKDSSDNTTCSVALEIYNCLNSTRNFRATISLLQLSMVAKDWQLVPVNFNMLDLDEHGMLSLNSNQSIVLHFKLKRAGGPAQSQFLFNDDMLGVRHTHYITQPQSSLMGDTNSAFDEALKGMWSQTPVKDEYEGTVTKKDQVKEEDAGSFNSDAVTPNTLDTSQWPMMHFIYNTPISPPSSDNGVASPTSPLSPMSPVSGSPLVARPVGEPPKDPLMFSCVWSLKKSNGFILGQSHIVFFPYQWNKGWVKNSIVETDSLHNLFKGQRSATFSPKPGPPSAPVSSPDAPKSSPGITFEFQYPSTVAHSFCNGSPESPLAETSAAHFRHCTVDVNLWITNHHSVPQSLELVLNNHAAVGYVWLGKSTHKLRDIPAGDTIKCPLKVGFLFQGVVDLCTFVLQYEKTKEKILNPHSALWCQVVSSIAS